MTRAQIHLPDHLYAEAKRIAAEQEMTLAEVFRRGLEVMARLYPRGRSTEGPWELPKAMRLGAFRAPVEQWRELANDPDPRLAR